MNVQSIGTVGIGLSRFWHDHGYQVVLGALIVVSLFMATALIVAWRRHRLDRWMSAVAGAAVLGLSAEGMWMVATRLLGLPVVVAICLFFVAEALMITFAQKARLHYQRTTVRDEQGAVSTPGTLGINGKLVWVTAVVGGVVVALNAASPAEFVLRLALPLGWAGMWWANVTEHGRGEAERSSWRWTPRRLLLRLGAIEPGDRDMHTIHRDRLRAEMTKLRCELEIAPPKKRDRLTRQLHRLARDADDEDLVEVGRRVTRASQVAERTAPGVADTHAEELAALQATHEHEMAELFAAQEQDLTAVREVHEKQLAEIRADLTRSVEIADRGRAGLIEDYERQIAELREALHSASQTAHAEAEKTHQVPVPRAESAVEGIKVAAASAGR